MVTLVGAGPGEKGLLTLKGARRIGEADVVIYDRFVSEEILSMIPEKAEKIDVGKTAGNHPVPQEEINRLILNKAQQGYNVVRLKGGDPFVFGRGGEELDLLYEYRIPFEVVPGITTAIAGAAYGGIPVTHREYASSLHIITGHVKNNGALNIDYDALVRVGGTLVFMMGVAAICAICEGCINAGMDANMPAAIIENATKSDQRKVIGTVGTLSMIAELNSIISPAVIIIGKVCLLSECFDWFSKKPLLGKKIIVSRASPGTSSLTDELRELGCHVIEIAPAKIVPLTACSGEQEDALVSIGKYSWLVITSAIGVDVFLKQLIAKEIDIRTLHHLKIACVGPETEKSLRMHGIIPDYRPSEANGTALAYGLLKMVGKDDRVLIARDKDGAKGLTQILADASIAFDDAAIYEKSFNLEKVDIRGAKYAAFTSSSAVRQFARCVAEADISRVKAICIGEQTAGVARSFGMDAFVSQETTIHSLIEKVKELCI